MGSQGEAVDQFVARAQPLKKLLEIGATRIGNKHAAVCRKASNACLLRAG
jgi:hypothetical protein